MVFRACAILEGFLGGPFGTWSLIWSLLGPAGFHFGASGVLLGTPWAFLGASLALLGNQRRAKGKPQRHQNCCRSYDDVRGAPNGVPEAFCIDLGSILNGLWEVLGGRQQKIREGQ